MDRVVWGESANCTKAKRRGSERAEWSRKSRRAGSRDEREKVGDKEEGKRVKTERGKKVGNWE